MTSVPGIPLSDASLFCRWPDLCGRNPMKWNSSAGRKRGNQRTRPRHGFNTTAGLKSGFHDPLAGIADTGTAGIRNQCDSTAVLKALDDFLAPPGFIEPEIA